MSSRETRRSEGQVSTPANSPRGQLFGRLLNSFASRIGQSGASADAHRVIAQCRALLSERGEVSGARSRPRTCQGVPGTRGEARGAFFSAAAYDGIAPDRRAIDRR